MALRGRQRLDLEPDDVAIGVSSRSGPWNQQNPVHAGWCPHDPASTIAHGQMHRAGHLATLFSTPPARETTMHLMKKLALAAVLATGAASSAMAADTNVAIDLGGSFTALLEQITIGSLSNVTGHLNFASGNYILGPFSLMLADPGSNVTVDFGSAGSVLATPTGYSFAFNNVAAGTYLLSATGNNAFGATAVNATYTVTAAPVPEPETYAMLMAGLGVVGFMARRKKKVA